MLRSDEKYFWFLHKTTAVLSRISDILQIELLRKCVYSEFGYIAFLNFPAAPSGLPLHTVCPIPHTLCLYFDTLNNYSSCVVMGLSLELWCRHHMSPLPPKIKI